MRRIPNHRVAVRRTLAFLAGLLALAASPAAHAHFLWLTAEREADRTTVHAFLNEPPVPDSPEFMKHIENATFSAEGQPLARTRGEDTFVLDLPKTIPPVVDGVCDLGVMTRGEARFRLLYTARLQFHPLAAEAPEADDGLRIALVARPEGPPRVRVLFARKPAAGAVVKTYEPDGSNREIKADGEGWIDCSGVAEGRVALLARWPDATPGEVEGKPFMETRHYATLCVADPDLAKAVAAAGVAAGPKPLAQLPEPINSFGGAVLGHHLYVYSGHTGTTHRYHKGTTSPHFRRLDLRDRTTWEDLPCATALQGVALVPYRDALYRTGGMMARNERDQPHDLVSVDEVARFDPESRTWTALPPLPEPRSTHDAAVLGDHLYVVGGWTMPGGDATESTWCEGALRLDLTRPEKGWERLSAPFERRALAAAAHDGKLYVIGGLTDAGSTVRDVEVYDPASGSWTKGPEFPGAPVQGFAPSAFEVAGRLHASGSDGIVYRLATDGAAWEPVARQAVPRITHRLLPGIDDDLLIVGGDFAGLPIPFLESLPLESTSAGPRSVAWSAASHGQARRSYSLAALGSSVVAAGGNRSPEPHALEVENLVAETLKFPLDGSAATAVAPLPAGLQSAVPVVVPAGRRNTLYLLGGVGQDGDLVRNLGLVHRLSPEGDAWTKLETTIPDERGLFGSAATDQGLWIFGGSTWDPRPGRPTREFPRTVLRWDPASEASGFEPTGHELPRGRRSFAGAALDGKYYLVGGLGEDGKLVETVDVFDFATGSWSTIPAPSQPRLFADLVALDGKLYLGGGFVRGEAHAFQPASHVEVFDPRSGTWSRLLDAAPIAVRDPRLLAVKGRLLFFGIEESTGDARFALVAP